MIDQLPLSGLRFSISGSAGDTTTHTIDRELLRRCHSFVYHLTQGLLRAGGELVVFVGKEPLLDPKDPTTAKVFAWTELEAIAAHLPQRASTHPDRCLLRAIASVDPAKYLIPKHRESLWDQLLAQDGAVQLTSIPARRYVGGHHRERQAEHADILITLGGGKGVFELHRQFREQGRQVVPLDPRIGSACNDGEASPALNREALEYPERFVHPSLAAWFISQLPRLSFSFDLSPEDLANRALQVVKKLAPVASQCTREAKKADGPAPSMPLSAPKPGSAHPVRSRISDSIHFLVLADEWLPFKGGISTFNRDLCKALARAGHRVSVFIPDASLKPEEREDLKALDGLTHVKTPHLNVPVDQQLLRRPELIDQPDIIIGHGTITGFQARHQREEFFPESKVLQFVHVAPLDTEFMKGYPMGEAMEKSEAKDREQAELAKSADLVVAIGPLLERSILDSLRAWQGKVSVKSMLPWFQEMPCLDPPQQKACLFVGRAESAHLKGLHIAVGAVSRLGGGPTFYIRGVTPEKADALQREFRPLTKDRGIKIRPQAYTPDQNRIDASFLRATAVLMPSRTEGFGLAGLEALMRGIPLLVSKESGLGEVLVQHGGELGRSAVVEIGEDDDENIARLHRKLMDIWEKPQASFELARKLREQLRPHFDEQKNIATFIDHVRQLLR